MEASSTPWQPILLLVSSAFVAMRAWQGWRLGVVRQVIGILALAAAYCAAILFGPEVAPLLRPLGWPDFLLGIAGGALLAAVVYGAITLVSAVLFKKTADQTVGLVRWGYGASGALVGGVFGLFLVWVATVALRLLGTLAEAEVSAAGAPAGVGRGTRTGAASPLVQGLADVKRGMEQGPAGAVARGLDPVPAETYSTIGKIGRMAGNPDSILRFLAFPGVKPLTEHPKIIALRDDPQIARDALAHNFLALLSNPRIVQAVNDPEIARLVRELEFQRALDHAVGK